MPEPNPIAVLFSLTESAANEPNDVIFYTFLVSQISVVCVLLLIVVTGTGTPTTAGTIGSIILCTYVLLLCNRVLAQIDVVVGTLFILRLFYDNVDTIGTTAGTTAGVTTGGGGTVTMGGQYLATGDTIFLLVSYPVYTGLFYVYVYVPYMSLVFFLKQHHLQQ